jgi:sec-independent protein translocase protein TatC
MTMSKFPNDDLFEGSKMTFGEHLDELRGALWKAVVGLAVGVGIGLFIGHEVVKFIQSPLTEAMEEYLLERAVDQVAERFKKQHPGDEAAVMPPALAAFVRANKVQPNVVLVLKTEVERVMAEMARKGTPAQKAADFTPGETPQPAAPPATRETKPANGAAASKPLEATPSPAPPVPVPPDPDAPPEFVEIYTWEPIHVKVSAMNVSEAFMIYLQAAIVSGLVFSSPWVFYQIWAFVAEGLYPHEKQYVYVFLPISLGLFLAGSALAFFFVFKPVLAFLFMYNKALEVDPDPRISEWIGFVLMLPIGFGLSFQLPLVMLFIERIGIVSAWTYVDHWRVAILVIFVLSAILTPADPISMLLMAVPLIFLYFGGIGLCFWLPIGRKPFDEAYEP